MFFDITCKCLFKKIYLCSTKHELSVDIKLIHIPEHKDQRGCLNVVEFETHIPFPVHRTFWISGVPYGQQRGGHAHWTCHEAVFAVSGSVSISIDNGHEQVDIVLDKKNDGVIIPAGAWCELKDFAAGTVLVVFASEPYDASGYCHDHNLWEQHFV